MGSTWTMDLPKDLEQTLKAAGYTSEKLSKEAMRYLAAGLFLRKVLSVEQGAKLAQMSLWEFIPFLGEQGITVADYDEEEALKEVESAGQWLKKNK